MGQDFTKEGTTTFPLQPVSSYRYRIELKSEKLSVWMEDQASKNQWFKGDMSVSDFVSPVHKIPDAVAADYAKCFYKSLSGNFNDPSHMQRKLTVLKDDRLQLEFSMLTKTLNFEWYIKNTFDLDPVLVERINVLELKLYDQGKELEKLREQQEELVKLRDQKKKIGELLTEMKANNMGSFIRLEATTTTDELKLRWDKIESEKFDVNSDDGTVKICQSGWYIIQVFVQSASFVYDQEVTLLVNGQRVQSFFTMFVDGNLSWNPLNMRVYLNDGDDVTVTCTTIIKMSSMSIVQIAN